MKYLLSIFVLFSFLGQAGTISIAAVPDCPYVCESNADEKGFLIDAATDVFNDAGYDVSYESVNTHEEAIKDLNAGKYDLVIGVDRKHPGLVFSKNPLAYKHNVIVVPTYSKWQYDSEESLMKLKLAVIKELDYSTADNRTHKKI